MQAYSVGYSVKQFKSAMNYERVDAKDRESAKRKIKRKIAKMYRINEDDVKIHSVGVIGYF